MTITHHLLRGSDNGIEDTHGASRRTLIYSVEGSDDLDAILDYLDLHIPSTFRLLVYRSLEYEHIGVNLWEFAATYVEGDKSDAGRKLELGEYTISFAPVGNTVTRSYSLATRAYGTATPDFRNAINVDENEVKGCEQNVPAMQITVRKRMPMATITTAYVKTLGALAANLSINNAAFLGFDARELLFLGASGQQGTATDPEVTYEFLYSPNVTGMTIGTITGIRKDGHEYLWVLYEPEIDGTAKWVVRRPKAVYVERVCNEADFGVLQI